MKSINFAILAESVFQRVEGIRGTVPDAPPDALQYLSSIFSEYCACVSWEPIPGHEHRLDTRAMSYLRLVFTVSKAMEQTFAAILTPWIDSVSLKGLDQARATFDVDDLRLFNSAPVGMTVEEQGIYTEFSVIWVHESNMKIDRPVAPAAQASMQNTQGVRSFVTAKIHRATVTDANVDYAGSIAICPKLMTAAGLMKFEAVHVNCVETGKHWETYVIPGESGEITLHGPPANLFRKGQRVVINRFELIEAKNLSRVKQTVVFVDHKNQLKEVVVEKSI